MAFIAALAFVLVPTPANPVRWRCFHPREEGEASLLVTRSLDAEGRPLSDNLSWSPRRRTDDSYIRWARQGPIESTTLPWTLRTSSIQARLVMTRSARRAVWLVLRVDGRIAGRRLLFRQMSELPEYDRNRLTVRGDFSADRPETGPVPDLANAAEILLTAEEEGGETLARSVISLPAPALVEEMITQVAPTLETQASDYRLLCHDTSQPPPVPPPARPR